MESVTQVQIPDERNSNRFIIKMSTKNEVIFRVQKTCIYIFVSVYICVRSAYDKFLDFFRIDIFIDSTHMKL